MWVSIGLDKTT